MPGPLAGLRVVDCSAIIAGPIATAFLATYGARVDKLEPLEGDALRTYPSTLPGLSRYFLGINRGKRSLALDLKHPQGLALARRLARTADVFVESFRPGVAARLGLDDGTLRAENPRLIYCSVSAFGQVGPLAERPGLDPVVQSYGGLAWEQGAAGEGAPELVRGSLVDYYTGSLAVSGILLALVARGQTGAGQRIETSLLDGVLAMQAGRAFWAQAQEPPDAVRDLLGDRVSRIYPTRDGHLYVSTWSCRSSGRDCAGRSGWRAGSTILASGPWSDATRTRRSSSGPLPSGSPPGRPRSGRHASPRRTCRARGSARCPRCSWIRRRSSTARWPPSSIPRWGRFGCWGSPSGSPALPAPPRGRRRRLASTPT